MADCVWKIQTGGQLLALPLHLAKDIKKWMQNIPIPHFNPSDFKDYTDDLLYISPEGDLIRLVCHQVLLEDIKALRKVSDITKFKLKQNGKVINLTPARQKRLHDFLQGVASDTFILLDNKVFYIPNAGDLLQVVAELTQEHALNVLTFNLGYNIQRDVVGGSEAKTVKRCQAKYDKYIDHLARCTYNASQFMSDLKVDAVFIQEAVSPEMMTSFASAMKGYKAWTPPYSECSVIYNSTLKVIPVEIKRLPKGVRCFAAVYVPEKKLLLASVHMDHLSGSGFKKAIEALNGPLVAGLKYQVDRIVLGMDSNDTQGNLAQGFRLLDHKLSIPGPIQKTCCEDVGYIYSGDYIFDSSPNPHFYGIPKLPKDWTPFTQLMSDHLPIQYVSK